MMVNVPPDYDPEYWEEQFDRVMADYGGKPITSERTDEMEERLAPIREGRWLAAREAFPWVEVWFEEHDPRDFRAELKARMSEDDARKIRELRTSEPFHTFRAIAEWAYSNKRETWRVGWTMPGHQEVGTMICEAAADRLGEDAHAEPWN